MESSTFNVVNLEQILFSSQKDKPRLWLLVISGSLTLHLMMAWLLYWLLVNKRVTTQVTLEKIPIEIVVLSTNSSTSSSSNSAPTATQEKSLPPSPQLQSEQPRVTRFSDLRPTPKTNSTPPNQANYRLSSQIKSDYPISTTPSSSFTRFSDLPNSDSPRQRQEIQTRETPKTSSVRRFSDVQGNSNPIREELVNSNSNLSSPRAKVPTNPSNSSSVTRFNDLQNNSNPNQEELVSSNPNLSSPRAKVPTNPSNSSSVNRFSDLQNNSNPNQEELVSSNPNPTSPPNSPSVNGLTDAQEIGRDFSNNNNILSQESLGGGLVATIIGNPQITNTEKDIPDQYARPKQNEIRLDSTDYLTNENIKINQTLRLKVIVLIDELGKAEIIPNQTQVLVGDINSTVAEKLLQEVLLNWEFEPTYMAGGAVFQSYYLTVEINSF